MLKTQHSIIILLQFYYITDNSKITCWDVYVFCIYMVEIPDNGVLLGISNSSVFSDISNL